MLDQYNNILSYIPNKPKTNSNQQYYSVDSLISEPMGTIQNMFNNSISYRYTVQ